MRTCRHSNRRICATDAGLTRRGLLRAVAPIAVGLAAAPALATAARATSALPTSDARLIALADALARHYEETEAYAAARVRSRWDPDDDPKWDALLLAYGPLEQEMIEMAAATMAGVVAKARAMQVPTCRSSIADALGNSLADDVWRLFGGAAA